MQSLWLWHLSNIYKHLVGNIILVLMRVSTTVFKNATDCFLKSFMWRYVTSAVSFILNGLIDLHPWNIWYLDILQNRQCIVSYLALHFYVYILIPAISMACAYCIHSVSGHHSLEQHYTQRLALCSLLKLILIIRLPVNCFY